MSTQLRHMLQDLRDMGYRAGYTAERGVPVDFNEARKTIKGRARVLGLTSEQVDDLWNRMYSIGVQSAKLLRGTHDEKKDS